MNTDDQIAVIVPTSPVPSNPSLDIITETIDSIRERLPTVEIYITADGIRGEQADRTQTYREFLRRLGEYAQTHSDITVVAYRTHLHQSGMLRRILKQMVRPYLLYVEHDCPLVGEIDFTEILVGMAEHDLRLVRFHHEAEIHEQSEHLYLDQIGDFRQTIQWSQRPHLADTKFYARLLKAHFSPDSRTMIEDVMHGIVQAGSYGSRENAEQTWQRWRLAVYAPPGNIKRSTHLDARGDDPKYRMLFLYPGPERPEGAPPPGWSK